jgi:flagellar biosynthesis/type III secretory pathway protein FliH
VARAPFAPPRVAGGSDLAAFPSRRRSGEFARWELGKATASAIAAVTPPDPITTAREAAFAESFAMGLEEGRAAGQAEYAAMLQCLQASVDEIVQHRAVLGEAYRREVVELALAAAEALVQRELGNTGNAIAGLVDQALDALGDDDPVTLRVCVGDAEQLAPWIEQRARPGLTVEIDTELRAGDLRATSAGGSVESSMERRIARVRQLVLGELEVHS